MIKKLSILARDVRGAEHEEEEDPEEEPYEEPYEQNVVHFEQSPRRGNGKKKARKAD